MASRSEDGSHVFLERDSVDNIVKVTMACKKCGIQLNVLTLKDVYCLKVPHWDSEQVSCNGTHVLIETLTTNGVCNVPS